MRMTENEKAMLERFISSDYQSSAAAPVGWEIWTWDVCEPFGKSAGGIMASLTKKGWATVAEGENADDDRCAITQAGWDALLEERAAIEGE